jgi:hypothetical protein
MRDPQRKLRRTSPERATRNSPTGMVPLRRRSRPPALAEPRTEASFRKLGCGQSGPSRSGARKSTAAASGTALPRTRGAHASGRIMMHPRGDGWVRSTTSHSSSPLRLMKVAPTECRTGASRSQPLSKSTASKGGGARSLSSFSRGAPASLRRGRRKRPRSTLRTGGRRTHSRTE